MNWIFSLLIIVYPFIVFPPNVKRMHKRLQYKSAAVKAFPSSFHLLVMSSKLLTWTGPLVDCRMHQYSQTSIYGTSIYQKTSIYGRKVYLLKFQVSLLKKTRFGNDHYSIIIKTMKPWLAGPRFMEEKSADYGLSRLQNVSSWPNPWIRW